MVDATMIVKDNDDYTSCDEVIDLLIAEFFKMFKK